MFYCYLHMRPDKEGVHSIFYVGKGNEKRIKRIHRDNRHHTRIVSKVGRERVEVHTMGCSTEAAAFELEIGIIKCLRRMGVKLCNQTDGGEGMSGHAHTAESRAKMSVAKRNMSDETKAKMSASQTGMKRSPEAIAKSAAAQIGNTNMLGYRHTAESRAKQSLMQMGKVATEETRVALVQGRRAMSLQTNNTSGYKGVTWKLDRWVARITVNSRRINLGRFKNIGDAIAARKAGEEKYWK